MLKINSPKIPVGLLFLIFYSCFYCVGCATYLPAAPQASVEYFKGLIDRNESVYFHENDRYLIGINKEGGNDYSGSWESVWNSWLYLTDSKGGNFVLLSVYPPFAPALAGRGQFLRKTFISPDEKVYCEYDSDPVPGNENLYLRMDLDGSDKVVIGTNQFYMAYFEKFVTPSSEFKQAFTGFLENKQYSEAEQLRQERLGKINSVLDGAIYQNAFLTGEAKRRYENLVKEKDRLERIVGLEDPALSRLREKFIATINQDQYDEANKIYELIGKMERKYKGEPEAVVSSTTAQTQSAQSGTFPEKIVIQHDEAPSAGKQMRSLATTAAALDGGMTPEQAQGWTALFGLGDFIDATGGP